MTDDEMKIAVAECCGAVWKRQSCTPWNPDDDSRNVYFRRLYFIAKDDVRGPALLPAAFGKESIADNHDHLPNYPADLNACAEMSAALTPDERHKQFAILYEMLGRGASVRQSVYLRMVDATARQRCEAFLKVKGLWKP